MLFLGILQKCFVGNLMRGISETKSRSSPASPPPPSFKHHSHNVLFCYTHAVLLARAALEHTETISLAKLLTLVSSINSTFKTSG